MGLVEGGVGAVFGKEGFVVTFFNDAAFVEDDDFVGVLDGAEAVGDDEDGAAFH